MSNKKTDLLQAAHLGYIGVPPPDNPPVDAQLWLQQHGVALGDFDGQTGAAFGLSMQGAVAVNALASKIVDGNRAYRRGADFGMLANALAHIMIGDFKDCHALPSPRDFLRQLETKLSAWFADNAVPRRFYVPCALILMRAGSFTVGPISFLHVDDLAAKKDLHLDTPAHELKFGQFFEAMKQRSACWVAEIEIDGCEEVRATAMADLAVDIALAGLQTVIPFHYSSNMARITGRTSPPWFGGVHDRGLMVHSRISWRYPGYGYSAGVFDQAVTSGRGLLKSVGKRVAAYVRGDTNIPNLDQSWCDAAYWFHEGLAEPIDTIAVAKLETATEVLLSAGSRTKSTERLRQAFRAFYGLDEHQPIADGSVITVGKLVEDIVESRSRVLHGTFSTLSPDKRVPRAELQWLVSDFIRRSTLLLDDYSTSGSPVDQTAAFLAWIEAQRSAPAGMP